MKVLAQPQDAEKIVKDYLKPLLAPEATCSIGVPEGWIPGDTPHLEVANDGSPLNAWPIVTYTTIRLTARAASTSEAKDLCGLAFGLLLANNDYPTRALTSPLPARDLETNAELASATVRVTVRTEPIDLGS